MLFTGVPPTPSQLSVLEQAHPTYLQLLEGRHSIWEGSSSQDPSAWDFIDKRTMYALAPGSQMVDDIRPHQVWA